MPRGRRAMSGRKGPVVLEAGGESGMPSSFPGGIIPSSLGLGLGHICAIIT